jgi:hypothetical protein
MKMKMKEKRREAKRREAKRRGLSLSAFPGRVCLSVSLSGFYFGLSQLCLTSCKVLTFFFIMIFVCSIFMVFFWLCLSRQSFFVVFVVVFGCLCLRLSSLSFVSVFVLAFDFVCVIWSWNRIHIRR